MEHPQQKRFGGQLIMLTSLRSKAKSITIQIVKTIEDMDEFELVVMIVLCLVYIMQRLRAAFFLIGLWQSR